MYIINVTSPQFDEIKFRFVGRLVNYQNIEKYIYLKILSLIRESHLTPPQHNFPRLVKQTYQKLLLKLINIE